ncbi:MAG TPA: M48 family metallopeptidase [Candidatus Angelobacter sp.]|nr:M48 family metallopeptidase [Candidatus Angelobacter sp.]
METKLGLTRRYARHHRYVFFLVAGVFLCCATTGYAASQLPTVPGTPQAQAPSPQLNSTPNPAAVPQASEQTKTEQYTLSHERYQKAVAYSRAGYTLYFLSYGLGFLFLFLILRLGIAARFRDFAENLSQKRWVQGLAFVPLLIVLVDVLDFPVEFYWHRLSLHYEQSVQGWGSWMWDWTKGEILTVFFTLVLVQILFAVMRFSPRRWWLYFWFPAVLILLGLMVITPLVIDPLFNKFEPLDTQHPDLVASIGKLTQRAGVPIPPERMFLMLASQKTNAINAYVTGLGASKRVVVWDTTIQKTTNDEALFIIGHELGHYVLNHVWKGFLLGAAGLLVALYLLFRGLYWALDHWGHDWKISGAEDWASLAVLLLLLQVLLFFSSPVINWLSRAEEHAADVYGLEVIHGLIPNSTEVAAHSFQVLGESDLSDPNPPPFIKFWLYSHPPLADRLIFAHSYDPWSKGKPPRYVK